MKTPIVKEKGFIVVDMITGRAYVVTDASKVARLIEKTGRTIANWFSPGNPSMIVKGTWMVVKGYEIVKSERGNKGKYPIVMSEVQENGDF